MKDDAVYTPSDCFGTFPFPEGVLAPLPDGRGSARETSLPDGHGSARETPLPDGHGSAREGTGAAYYDFRAALMVRNNEGLTKTYNRFHDPNERSADIVRLRELHAAMDRVVLDAYGWTNLQPTCEFLLDEEADDESEGGGRQRKKPWRYRWPNDLRDEVLARLLELNKQRAGQEAVRGPCA